MILPHYIHPEESVNTYLVLTASVLSFFFDMYLAVPGLVVAYRVFVVVAFRIFSCGMQNLVH